MSNMESIEPVNSTVQEINSQSTGLDAVLSYLRERTELTGEYGHDILAAFAVSYADGVNSVSKDKA